MHGTLVPPRSRSASVRRSGAGQPFVGRARELELIERALEEARNGHGSILLVSGEAGIGKTRLCEVAVEWAPHEVRVAWGRAWEAGGAPAFLPWAEVLRSLDAPAGLAADDAVRAMLPELDRGEEPLLPRDPDAARFAVFDACLAALRKLTARSPLMLVLEDLHAADVATVLLLEFVAARAADVPMLILATQRSGEAPAPVAEILQRAVRHAPHIVLEPLTPQDVSALVASSSTPPDPVTLRHIEDAGGNPLFVTELVRLGASGGVLSGGLQDAIRRRVRRLPQGTALVLEAAAVLGRDFAIGALPSMLGMEPPEALEHLEPAVTSGLLQPVPGDPGRLRFSHALVMEVLAADVPPRRRAVLHRAAGDALQKLHGALADRHVREIAHHYVEAAPWGHGSDAADFAYRAGVRALDLLAYEDAVELLETALRLLELEPPVDEQRRCHILLALGDARGRTGDRLGEWEVYDQAIELAAAIGEPDLLATAALGYAGHRYGAGEVQEPIVERLERAVVALGAAETPLRARVTARLALEVVADFELPRERREPVAAAAYDLARRVDDVHAIGWATIARVVAGWGPDRIDQRLRAAAELLALATRAREPGFELVAHGWAAGAHLERGDRARFDAALAAYLARSGRQHGEFGFFEIAMQGAVAAFEGRFDDAGALMARLGAEAPRRAPRLAANVVGMTAFALALWGPLEPQPLEAPLRQLRVDYPRIVLWRLSHAYLLQALGRLRDAREALESVSLDELETMPPSANWLLALTAAAEVSAGVRDIPRCRLLRRMLEPYADQHCAMSIYFPIASAGPVARYLGLLDAALGEPRVAAVRFEQAMELSRRLRSPVWLARVQLDLAGLVLEQRELGGADRAAALLDAAASTAEACGLQRLSAQIAEVSERARAAGPAAPRLQRRDGGWMLVRGHRETLLAPMRGLEYLATLMSQPEREVHVLELVNPEGLDASAASEPVPALDREAKLAYRRRLDELEEAAEEAAARGDDERLARVTSERDFLVRELARAIGLGGRDRHPLGDAERARVSVTRAMNRAIARVAAVDPDAGAHLQASVRTGTYCSYRPPPLRP